MAWLGALALFVGLLTVFSMSKIWIEAFWKTSPRKVSRVRAVPVAMLVPIAALGAITLAIGFNPEPLVAFANVAAGTMTDPAEFIAAVFAERQIAGATP
jgi:multicomponent Na+:H+ antiporter subunit D